MLNAISLMQTKYLNVVLLIQTFLETYFGYNTHTYIYKLIQKQLQQYLKLTKKHTITHAAKTTL